MLMMLAPLASIISIIGAPFHQFGGMRLRPFCFLVCFIMALGWRGQTTNDHIWPHPWFWPEPWCNPLPKQPKITSSGPNPGSGPENLGLGQMWSFWVFLGTQENRLGPLHAACAAVVGRSPCLDLWGAAPLRPTALHVHHQTSVSSKAPPGPHSKPKLKFTCAPTANPKGTEGPKNPQNLHHEHGPF